MSQTGTPCPLNCNEVKKGIRKLKNEKKEGPDMILNELIKTGSSSLILTLVKLFNKILKSGKFPNLHEYIVFEYISLIIRL